MIAPRSVESDTVTVPAPVRAPRLRALATLALTSVPLAAACTRPPPPRAATATTVIAVDRRAPAATPTTIPTARTGCLPHTTRDSALITARAVGDGVLVCYATTAPADTTADTSALACRMVADPDSAHPHLFETTERPAEFVPTTGPFAVKTTAKTIEVCPTGKAGAAPRPACRTLKPPFPAPTIADDTDHIAAASPDGKTVIALERQNDETFVNVLDVASGRRTSRAQVAAPDGEDPDIGILRDTSNVWSLHVVGRRAIVNDASCCGPGMRTVLLDPTTGKTLHLHGYQGTSMPVGGSMFLVLDRNEASFVDVERGTRSATVTAGGEIEDPELSSTSAVIVGSRGYVVHARPPGILRFDPQTATFGAHVDLPICDDDQAPASER